MNKQKFYTAIGPHKLNQEQGILVERVTGILVSQGYGMRSIGGDGFDTHAFLGVISANGKYEITIPWIGFSGLAESEDGESPIIKAVNHLPNYIEVFKEVQRAFPNMCKTAGEDLFATSHLMTLLGRDLQSPAAFMLTMDLKSKNTTRAMTMAKEFNIPVFDLLQPQTLDELEAFISK